MGTAGPYVTVIVTIDKANEMVKVRGSLRMTHVQDRTNFLFPGFDATRSEPITKPICFLDCPFTFKWVDGNPLSWRCPKMVLRSWSWM